MQRISERKVCVDCGEIYFGRNSDLCKECREKKYYKNIPEPEDVGECECWFDGAEYKIHECDNRRKIARERREKGLKYMMPYCADCTPEMATKLEPFVPVTICAWCQKEFAPKQNQQRYCSRTCSIARQNHTYRMKVKRSEKADS